MRSKENCVDSMKVMEIAFQNILNEIIEHAIEGICFEAHRAVKLGYFPVNEYILKEHKFACVMSDSDEESSGPGDIFGNDQKKINLLSECPCCNQQKATNSLMRHIKKCRPRTKDSSKWNNDKRENYENNAEDEYNSDGKKIFDAKKQAKSAPNYDTMTPEQKQDFLYKHCGVVSKRTRKPCSNSLICNKHSKEDKDEVRRLIFESLADHLVDDNIDIDTVD
ncbi:hypothetical protein AVEN_138472-2 [Araneus ventricosus]|uniref:SCA7 domain-containing protein n=1 Tax=Araneus ventricosus TaxID=182803 RepID=A0A4Y2CET0_ARAVE|nr:hypothetical protein AVEN_138472-2 [Araneus ventricosus]